MKRIICSLIGIAVILTIISVNLVAAQELDMDGKLAGKMAFILKCGKCHSLERATNKTKTPAEWKKTVKNMHGKAHGWISDKDAAEIIYFLSAKALFETKCTACHSNYRALDLIKDKAGWMKTVKNMRMKKDGLISDAEAKKVILYLFSIQGGEFSSPESVK